MKFLLPPCPLLPEVETPLDASVTREFVGCKDALFYEAALRYAQSLWRQAKPAQAILQLNKSFMAALDGSEPVLQRWPAPYATLVWFLRHRQADFFIGNPVRHFQHLATRVSGERRELRSWRAWACFHLAREILPASEFPSDHEQIAKDKLVLPEWSEVLEAIRQRGWKGEDATLLAATDGRAMK